MTPKEPNRKTIVAVLASHDSIQKNNELVTLFRELWDSDHAGLLKQFHFLFTGGTFRRIVLGEDAAQPPRPELKRLEPDELRELLMANSTVLPDRRQGGVTILADVIVNRQCSLIWTFLSPITAHWLSPENMALMRLCDIWKVKRLMNAESVRGWFRDEAKRDVCRNRQQIPLSLDGNPQALHARTELAKKGAKPYYEIRLPARKRPNPAFWAKVQSQSLALIANDSLKARIVDFAVEYENELCQFQRILTTEATGREVEGSCRKLRECGRIRKYLPGPKGGDIEIATEILLGRCHVVIFFVDPWSSHAHIDDIRVVFSACMAEIENNCVRMLTNELDAREWIEETVRQPSAGE